MKQFILFLLLSVPPAAMAQAPSDTLKHPNPTAGSQFGANIVVLGNDVFISAPRIGEVYRFDGATRRLLNTYRHPAPAPDDGFGVAIATFGEFVYVGAPSDDAFGPNAGAVYRFDRNSESMLDSLSKPQPAANDSFGQAIAVAGNVIVVGAPNDDTDANNAGRAYFFDAASAQFGGTIEHPAPNQTEFFGFAIAASGRRAYIGAYSHGAVRADAGAVFVFESLGSENPDLVQVDVLLGSDYDSTGQTHGFGYALALGDSRLAVGAPFRQEVLLLDVEGNLLQRYRKDSSEGSQDFGRIIAASGNRVLVSGLGDRDFVDGIAVLFDDQSFVPRMTFENPSTTIGDDFGRAVAFAGANLLVGAPFANNDSGLVYVFALQQPPQITPLADAKMFAGASLSLALSATAPGNDAIVFAGQNLPPFARLENRGGGTGALIFNPTYADTGVYADISITATDQGETPLSSSTTFSLSVFAADNAVVINEILSDPNYDDAGQERIELKNLGGSPVSFANWKLWVHRDTLDTFWQFPGSFTLAPDSLVVIHWLREGTNDAGNLFTGEPQDDDDGGEGEGRGVVDDFTGNNSSSLTEMQLGGPQDQQQSAFTAALIQGGTVDLAEEVMVEFVQIGGVVPISQAQAASLGLWRPGTFLEQVREGLSYERLALPADSLRTEREHYFAQPSPSLGFDNVLALPPAEHLLVSEVCLRPNTGEFVEIYNPADSAISLRHYYLTDHVETGFAYTTLVQGLPDSLGEGDFVAQFPDTVIQRKQYLTVAFDAVRFKQRYGSGPNFEIGDSDGDARNDMIVTKSGRGKAGLDNQQEALVLFNWDGRGDLAQDVDYIAWGPDASDKVQKTSQGFDGPDAGAARTYYDVDTNIDRQRKVKDAAHEPLRSWQRPRQPREFDERTAGGNGISGHDETSENLARAFAEAAPTPGRRIGELDLEPDFAFVLDTLAFANRDGILDRGEKAHLRLRLRNVDTLGTGNLISILRSETPEVTVGPDSLAAFSNIEPGATGLSLDFYEITAKDEPLPVIVHLTLSVIDKDGGSVLVAVVPIQILTSIKVHSIFFTVSTTPQDTTLLAFFKLRNEGRTTARNLRVEMNLPDIGQSESVNIARIDSNGAVMPSFLTHKLRVRANASPPLDVLNRTQLAGCLKIASSEICPTANCLHQNANLLVTFNLPRVAVTVEYFHSRVLVPGMTVNLVEDTAPAGTEPVSVLTDTFGRAEFSASLIEPAKSYHLEVLQQNDMDTPEFLHRRIDLVDINDCDSLLSPALAFKLSAAKAARIGLLGNVSADAQFSSADAEMIDIFADGPALAEEAMIGQSGKWRVLPAESFALPAGFTGRKFLTVQAYRLGDVNADWTYPRNEFQVLQISPVSGQQSASTCSINADEF